MPIDTLQTSPEGHALSCPVGQLAGPVMHLPPVVSHVPTQSVLLEHDFGAHCELAHVMSVPHWLSLEHDCELPVEEVLQRPVELLHVPPPQELSPPMSEHLGLH